jgi:hypothetical protein
MRLVMASIPTGRSGTIVPDNFAWQLAFEHRFADFDEFPHGVSGEVLPAVRAIFQVSVG